MSEIRIDLPHKQIGVAVIWDSQKRILIDRRLDKGEMGGLWEFPGGKIELGETVAECIEREIREELEIEVSVGEPLIIVKHHYNNFKVTLFVHHCQYLGGTPKPIACQEFRWVRIAELDGYRFPQANTQIIRALQQ
jgi:mutator protein MutT